MRASAGGAPDDDDETLPGHLVDLTHADVLAHLRRLLATSSADSDDAAHVVAELERRLHEADDRVRASNELAATMREKVKVLRRSATASQQEIRRPAETEARLRSEIDAQRHTAAGHQAVLETLEQRAVGAEAKFLQASESKALIKTKIQELESKAAMVEASHRAEIEAIEGRAVKAEAELKEADHKMAMNFQVRLEAIISEAEHAAAMLEVSHRLKIQALESRVTELESSLGDEMTHRDRMATLARHFEARIEVIASEAKRAADGVKDRYRVEIEALQQLVTETKERLSDEISKHEALALECQQHLLQGNCISEDECVTNEDRVKVLAEISAGKKKVAELDSEIRDGAAEVGAVLRRGIEEDEDIIAALKASIAKNRAMTANDNYYEEDGQQRCSSPTHMPSAQTSEHYDVVDLTTSSEDDDV